MYRPELKAAGTHFFCLGCLVHRPIDDRSADPRYCQSCFDFLLEEASLLPPTKRPAWIPKGQKKGDKKTIPIPRDTVLIMSTINDDKIRSGHNSPAARPPMPIGKRGPKFRDDIPVDIVNELAAQGMGAWAIAAELKKERGITVSYKTVQRILAGQRVLVE